MIKKLAALLLLSASAYGFSPARYVQISTNTFSRQLGTATISGLDVSTVTASTVTIATLTVSSNTVLSGATFYMQGPIQIGTSGQSVTFSSNTILPGATFYQSGPVSLGDAPKHSVFIASNTTLGVGSTLSVNGSSGTYAQVMISSGSTLSPFWGFQGVIQATGCTATSAFSTSATTFTQTNTRCTITPKSATSRIFIAATGELDDAGTGTTGLTIMRGSTNNLTASSGLVKLAGGGIVGSQLMFSMFVVDNNYLSTNTTTYYVGLQNSLGDTPSWGSANTTQQMTVMEIQNP